MPQSLLMQAMQNIALVHFRTGAFSFGWKCREGVIGVVGLRCGKFRFATATAGRYKKRHRTAFYLPKRNSAAPTVMWNLAVPPSCGIQ